MSEQQELFQQPVADGVLETFSGFWVVLEAEQRVFTTEQALEYIGQHAGAIKPDQVLIPVTCLRLDGLPFVMMGVTV